MQRKPINDPVEILRGQVDFSPYNLPAAAPSWLVSLHRDAVEDLGILGLLGPGGLNVSGNNPTCKASIDPLSLFIAALASTSRNTGRKVAIGLPPGARHLPLLLAATTVLADAVAKGRAKALGERISGLSGVLVVSPDLDVRSRYSDLCVQNEKLDSVYPGSRMRPDGQQIFLRPDGARFEGSGVCFYLPGLKLPHVKSKPALAVLDLRYARFSKRTHDIAEWACRLHPKTEIIALYTMGDRDTLDELTKARFEDLPFDHGAVAASNLQPNSQSSGFGIAEWGVVRSPSYLNREHEIISLDDPNMEGLLVAARHIISDQGRVESLGLNRARWILATLTHMPVPLGWYEQAARNSGRSTLKRLVDRLCVQHDPGMGAALQALKMQFEAIMHALELGNPRAEQIRALLPKLVADSSGQLLLLVRDRTMQRAMQNWLDLEAYPNTPWLRNVEIRSCSDYAPLATQRFPIVLVQGTFPRRYRWIAGAALGYTVKFLAYASETESIVGQLGEMYEAKAIRRRAMQRDRILSPLIAGSRMNAEDLKIPELHLKRPPIKKAPAESVGVKDVRNLSGALEATQSAVEVAAQQARDAETDRRMSWEDATDEEPPEGDTTDPSWVFPHEDDISCIQFYIDSKLRGEGHLWLAEQEIIECVRADSPDEISRVTPGELNVHDIIILIEEGGRGSLFDKVVELAAEQPDHQYLGTYRKAWRDAMRLLASRYNKGSATDYQTMLADLRSAGSKISTELSVRNWILDRVIGPDDLLSIKAVGHVTEIDSLVRECRDFDRAFRTIRSIHQGLGRRLTRAIRESSRQFVGGAYSGEIEALGQYIWLPLAELLETVDLAEVIEIKTQSQRIAPNRVGRFVPLLK